jgi:hypothetical protein
VKNNPALNQLLNPGKQIKNLTKIGPVVINEFKGNYQPTYLKIIGFDLKNDCLYRKQVPINSYALMKFETDATNDYLSRDIDGGSFKIFPDIMKSRNLWNGIITAKIVPPKNVNVGDIKRIKAILTRPFDSSLEVEFEIKFSPEIKPTTNPPTPPKPPKVSGYEMPSSTLVYKNPTPGGKTWEEEDPEKWNEEYIAEVNSAGDNKLDILINMDAGVLHEFLRRMQPSQKKMEEIKRTYKASIYLYAFLLYNELKKYDDIDSILPTAMKGIAKITLDLIWNENLIKQVESPV